MIRHTLFLCCVFIVTVATSQAQNVEYFWQGGSGTLTDANYFNGTASTSNQLPGTTTTDFIHIGLDGVVTLSGGNGAGLGRLRVGHNVNPTAGTYEGAGTLTLTGVGTELQVTGGAAAPNAAVWVGNGHNGELNIEDGALMSANRLVVVGAGSNGTPTGTLNVRTGGWLRVLDGNLSIADRATGTGNGVRGVVNLSDVGSKISIEGPNADLIVGARSRTATFTQTNGTVEIVDSIEVANSNSSSTGSTLSISGGSITTGMGGTGNFFVGRGSSVGATVNVSGTAVVNVGQRYLMGGSDTPPVTDPPTPPSAIATGSITHHSGGTLNTDLDIRIADTFIVPTSEATYNLSGTGIINTNVSAGTSGKSVIGRQGIGRFFQTGGTANLNSPLHVGNRDAETTTTANGLYEISAGALNVNAPTPTWPLAMSIAPNGTGEFRVVGDDATIAVTGDFDISSTANGNGTLAFELETGDSLSMMNITGAATFNAGSILAFDFSNAAPTQTTYDVLTATTITDLGISFFGSGWGYQIVPGGNGQILQLVQGAADQPGDHNEDGVVDAADYVAWRKLNIDGAQGYTDFVQNFGESTPGSGGGGPVPEPATLLLCCVAACGLSAMRRR